MDVSTRTSSHGGHSILVTLFQRRHPHAENEHMAKLLRASRRSWWPSARAPTRVHPGPRPISRKSSSTPPMRGVTENRVESAADGAAVARANSGCRFEPSGTLDQWSSRLHMRAVRRVAPIALCRTCSCSRAGQGRAAAKGTVIGAGSDGLRGARAARREAHQPHPADPGDAALDRRSVSRAGLMCNGRATRSGCNARCAGGRAVASAARPAPEALDQAHGDEAIASVDRGQGREPSTRLLDGIPDGPDV